MADKTINGRVTLKAIAESSGVSIATVSRVLRNQAARYRIRNETVNTVLAAAKKLGYTSEGNKEDFHFPDSYTIGLIVPDISNPFFAAIAQRIEIEGRKKHYLIVLSDSLRDINLEKESVKLLRYRNVDGFIIAPIGTEFTHLNRICEDQIPLVMFDRYFENLKCPYVISDNYKGAFEAVSYLIENGHRTIGCIQGLAKTSVNENRVKGFVDALKSHSITVDESLIVGDSFTEYNGYVNTKILLNRKKRPTAIFTANNFISIGSYRAIVEENIQIPEEISFIGFDDYLPYSEIVTPPLTAVRQQIDEMGHIVFQLLMNQIKSGNKASMQNSVVLPTKLIVRKSVKNILQS
jgi:LacI family transcriptional regulator